MSGPRRWLAARPAVQLKSWLMRRPAWIGLDRRYGSWRGAVRAALAWLQFLVDRGRREPFLLARPERVRRVVFICLGNICRSAYAHGVARTLGMASVSAGLSTTTGAAPPDAAISAARRQGQDLSSHRATDLRDLELRSGDLLLVMEACQARELRRRLGGRIDIDIALLGLWCTPPMPHLHDPYTLGDAYFDTCYTRVRQAVTALHLALPQLSRASSPLPPPPPLPHLARLLQAPVAKRRSAP